MKYIEEQHRETSVATTFLKPLQITNAHSGVHSLTRLNALERMIEVNR